ncbi:MAG: zf-TFIIB domain-containing protein, partial [Gemmatimonadetes bacterium]|nr:zf-TFIIB domain-containing protein [Gemmatimonadota bacterium]
MRCVDCQEEALEPCLTRQGVEVDGCHRCGGIWLDEGELFFFTHKPLVLAEALREASARPRASARRSPRTGMPLEEISLFGDVATVALCPKTNGVWLPAVAQVKLMNAEPTLFALEVVQSARRSGRAAGAAGRLGGGPGRSGPRHDGRGAGAAGAQSAAAAAARAGQAAAGGAGGAVLPALPNLQLYATATMLSLYALLGVGLIVAIELGGIDADTAIAFGFGLLVVQFLLGPYLMDLALRLFYTAERVQPYQLPPHLRGFVDRSCRMLRMPFPRFVIIHDGA